MVSLAARVGRGRRAQRWRATGTTSRGSLAVLRHYLLPYPLGVHFHALQHPPGHAGVLAQECEQNVLGSNIEVAQRLGLFGREP